MMSTFFWDSPARNSTIGRETDKKVIDGLLNTEDVGSKSFRAFVQGRLVEGKKSFFELICKAKLKTGDQEENKDFKIFFSLQGSLLNFWFTW